MSKPSRVVYSSVLVVSVFLAVAGSGSAPAQDPATAKLGSVQPDSSTPVSTQSIERIPGHYIVELEQPPLALADGEATGFGLVPRLPDGRLDVDSAAALDYVEFLRSQQNLLIDTARAQIQQDLQVTHRYQHAFNGFSVQIDDDAAAALASLPGVKAVHPVRMERLLTDAGPQWIGADEIWNNLGQGGPAGTRGEGIVVGIIDSGINNDHPSFAETSPADGFVHTNPLGSGNFLGYCVDNPGFCNNKLIGAYDFIWPLVSGIPDISEDETPQDENGHGSHTASTVAGNPVDTTFQGNAVTISGVAPRANIINYDVCFDGAPGSGPGGCAGDALVAAVNQAIADGLVNVINYSISGGVNPYSDPVSQAFLSATNAGIIVVASAGNSGPGPGTLGHQEPWVVSVGAATHDRAFLNSVSATGPGTPPAEVVDIPARQGNGPQLQADLEAPIIDAAEIDPANVSGCAEFPAGSLDGAIVVVDLFDCFFRDKVNNADAAGAVGVIMRATFPGFPFGIGGLEQTQIPAFSIAQEGGDALVAFIASNPGATAVMDADISSLPRQGDVLASFSSRGPNTAFDVLKPDVIAPGSDVLAALATPGAVGGTPTLGQTEIGLLSGTSMSSPHVAGTAALLKSLHPNWSPSEIKSAIMTTAKNDAIFKEDTVTPADPFDKGNGRVDVPAAADAALLMSETGDNFADADPDLGGDPASLNLAGLMDSACFPSCSWQRTVTNGSGAVGTWEFSAESVPGLELSAQPSSFTLGIGRSQTVTITADTAFAPVGQWAYGTATFTETAQGNGATTHFNAAVLPVASASDDATLLSKSGPPLVFEGEAVPYTISVTNSSLTGELTISDTLPPEVEFVPGSQSVTVNGGTETVPFNFDSGTRTVSWSGTLDPGTLELQPSASPLAGITSATGFTNLVGFGVPPVGCDTDCDEFFADFTTPEFSYNGSTHTSVRVSTNGYLLPSSDFLAASFTPQQMPDATAPNNVIAPFWADMDLDGTDAADPGAGSFAAATFGFGNGAVFIVQWTGVEIFDEPGVTYTFQIQIFDEETGSPGIWFVYDSIPSVASNVSVGVEGVNGQVGSTFYFSDGAGGTSGTAPAGGDALRVIEGTGGSVELAFETTAGNTPGDAVNVVDLQTGAGTVQASQTTAIRQDPDIVFEDGFESP